ncbi:cysteine--tRNA ligase [bacterium]|nr:cysteine--tRNA ligase [bacterium]
MSLRITNSMTRQKEEFVPLDPEGKKVLFYNCGPTVYGPFHIGNARNFVVVDVMRRWLEYSGYDVNFVQNLTDVDDKIIARATEEGIPAEEVAEKYTKLFFEHAEALGVRRATRHPKATEFIGQMIGLIKSLVDKDHAYASEDGSVWFDVRSFKEYGRLSRKKLDDMRQGERVLESQQKLKRSPLDFCLWKAAKPGEPAWDSPWGKGRPGWHIECSVMSMACLGSDTIDIHAGGADLRFPHHENEIAQSECHTGHPFVRYWVHNGFLNIDGEKMSKSLKNFKTIDALLEKFDPITLRHFLISAHYGTELDFTVDNLEAAQKASTRYSDAYREALHLLGDLPEPEEWENHEQLVEVEKRFAAAMDDDFNTAQALAVLFDLVTIVNSERARVERGETDEKAFLAGATALLGVFREVLGVTCELEPEEEQIAGLEEDLLQLLIDIRARARQDKQYALADMVRDRLGDLGIALEDRPGGTIWKKS